MLTFKFPWQNVLKIVVTNILFFVLLFVFFDESFLKIYFYPCVFQEKNKGCFKGFAGKQKKKLVDITSLSTLLQSFSLIVGQPDRVEASDMGRERIHPWKNKRDSLLNTLQRTSGQDSKGKTGCRRVVVMAIITGWSEEIWEYMGISFFGNHAQL